MNFSRVLEEGSTQAGIGWLVWVALAIFFLMVFLGWWVSNKGLLKKEEEPAHAEHGHEDVASSHAHTADDLTTLEGIGGKVARVLAGVGVTTFSDLANADYKKLKTALDAAGYKYMDPAGWIDQAKLVVKGDTAGLKKLQATLKGGRKAK